MYILREIPFLNIMPECCIPSKRVINAASCASMFDMSVLLLVAELAMLLAMGATANGELVSWERWTRWGATTMARNSWGLTAMGPDGNGADRLIAGATALGRVGDGASARWGATGMECNGWGLTAMGHNGDGANCLKAVGA